MQTGVSLGLDEAAGADRVGRSQFACSEPRELLRPDQVRLSR